MAETTDSGNGSTFFRSESKWRRYRETEASQGIVLIIKEYPPFTFLIHGLPTAYFGFT